MEVVLRGNFGWDRKNTKVPCLTKCLSFIAILMSRGTTANKTPISCHLGVLNCWCSVPEVWSLTFINKQGQKNVILSFCISSRPPLASPYVIISTAFILYFVILPFIEKIDFVSIAKILLKMIFFYLIVLCINISEKKYSKLLDTTFLNCLLTPHSFVHKKQTCQYTRDCLVVRNKFSTIRYFVLF